MTDDPDAPYLLIVAVGRVAEAAGLLLAWVQPYNTACRLCHQLDRDGHDPTMPCGQLRARITELSATVRAVTGR